MVPPNPNHQFIDRFSIINHPFLGTIYGKKRCWNKQNPKSATITGLWLQQHMIFIDIHAKYTLWVIEQISHLYLQIRAPGCTSEIDLPYENWSLENTRPGKRLHKTMENHHAINGKIHYFYGHFPVRKLLVYQRVYPSYIPLNPIKSPLNHHWITIFNR